MWDIFALHEGWRPGKTKALALTDAVPDANKVFRLRMEVPRPYYQALLSLEDLRARGLTHFYHSCPMRFYQLLLLAPRPNEVPRGVSSATYDILLHAIENGEPLPAIAAAPAPVAELLQLTDAPPVPALEDQVLESDDDAPATAPLLALPPVVASPAASSASSSSTEAVADSDCDERVLDSDSNDSSDLVMPTSLEGVPVRYEDYRGFRRSYKRLHVLKCPQEHVGCTFLFWIYIYVH